MADQPTKIHLDLDELSDDRGYEPYTFTLKGKPFTFTDPSVLDWQVAERLTTLDALAEHCMSEEDKLAFYAIPLASHKLEFLFDDVQKHFEIGPYASKRRRTR